MNTEGFSPFCSVGKEILNCLLVRYLNEIEMPISFNYNHAQGMVRANLSVACFLLMEKLKQRGTFSQVSSGFSFITGNRHLLSNSL